ncbi:MAG: CDP-alcohol phosphatidyltransferase family protein [Micrococcales bacterium]|nr:CDP-alcohol phosphatidyltransferase family protein [Micrococcales bacterium]MCL2666690.1 CDP-alcohol phosphatidyltransferase family protein [Micrococcales bacterium]
MIAVFHRSNLVTYANIAVATLGVVLVVSGQALGWAVACLIVAGACDLLDGTFARRFDRTTLQRSIGVQLDSLADVVGFGALPVVLMAGLGGWVWASAVVGTLYAISAVSRLAFFNVHASPDRPVPCYRGLPVTSSALILPALWLTARWAGWSEARLWTVGMAALAVGFVLDVRVGKPRGQVLAALAVIAVGFVVAVVWETVW